MTSKISRFIPLLISCVVFAGVIFNFRYYKFDLAQHFRSGAGYVFGFAGRMWEPPFFANLYLHFSLLLLFFAGILLFTFNKRISKNSYIAISIFLLILFVLRPVITALLSINLFRQEGSWYEFIFLRTLKGQLLGASSCCGVSTNYLVESYISGLGILLLLVVNMLFAFRHKQDPVYAQRKQQQRDFLHQQAQARQSAWSAQQQIQAQALPQMPMPVQQQSAPSSMTQELERLQQMYQSGVLTEAEFIAAKQRIIGG
jgi:hypothetical protein